MRETNKNKKYQLLIIFAHPAFHKSRINSRLLREIHGEHGITIHHLYEQYPDFYIDVKKEQELLQKHDVIIWQHPFYWYSSPALLKEWMDLVLVHDFAYGREGNALKDKLLLNIITAGGSREAYSKKTSNYTIRELISPFERTAKLCKMRFLPPFVFHGTHLMEKKDIIESAQEYKKVLTSLRDGLIDIINLQNQEYFSI